MTVTLDGENTFSYDHVYFTAVMNQKYEGGGFKFCRMLSLTTSFWT